MTSTASRPGPALVDDGVVPYPAAVAQAYRAAGYWTGQTLDGLLREAAREAFDRHVVIDTAGRSDGEVRRWTYGELDRRVECLAAGLAADGLRRGERVVVQLPNIAEFLQVVFALFRLGAVPVFALPAHRRFELVHFAATSEAAAVVTVDRHGGFDHRALAVSVADQVPSVRRIVVVPRDEGEPGPVTGSDERVRSLPQLTIPRTGARREIVQQPEDLAFLQLSGGTTGRPKLIPRTSDDYLYSVRESARICQLDADSVLLAALPVAHNFTMSSPGILGVIHARGTVVLTTDPSPESVLPLLATHRVSVLPAVPPMVLSWLNSPQLTTTDLSSLRLVQVGGAKLSRAVAERIEPAFGCRLQQVFGMAEGLVNYTRWDDDTETVYGTQGRPISPADEVQVVDDSGVPVPDGTPGHLLTRGPYTIRGYFRAPEHNATTFTADGFYRTGDLVIRRPDGYLTVVGRAKDQINRGGEKIAPEEVENALLRHPGVHDVSVVALPDDVLGERIGAHVVLRPGTHGRPPRPVDLRRLLRAEGLADYKIPDAFYFVDRLPSTGVGKVDRKPLRDGLTRPASPSPRPAEPGGTEVDVVGVGCGPANLALAVALHEGSGPPLRSMFFEASPEVRWHPGMLLPNSHLQVSFLKDLVTFRNPTSPYTFVNFLAESGRLVDFTNRGATSPLRLEFAAYLRWAAQRLITTDQADLRFGCRVQAVLPVPDEDGSVRAFDVLVASAAGMTTVRSRAVVLAAGLQPRLPAGAVLGDRVWHSGEYLPRVTRLLETAPLSADLLVVGSGQSAVEVALDLNEKFPNAVVHLVSSQFGIGPSEHGPLVNQIFDPDSVDLYERAPSAVRDRLDRLHGSANHGAANPDVVTDFFDRQYRDRWLGRERLVLHRVSRVTGLTETAGPAGPGVRVQITHDLDGWVSELTVAAAVLATGYRPADPAALLGHHADLLVRDDADRPLVDRACRARLTRPASAGLYLVGQSSHQHGLGSTLLSNVAVRAGEISESLRTTCRPVRSATPPLEQHV